ncbi:hypothetical protein Scep_002820 [Stephania cephalantha]|uniref:F-box domain-containing protein n=1 Tax=Stephania cephalantha TaxID=152367 RepID=A0AAP0LFT5_9MAGN
MVVVVIDSDDEESHETEQAKKKKKLCLRGGGGEGEGRWEGVSAEILSLVFVLVPADELLRTVPFVCRAWREAVAGPECWADIDIEKWCRRCNCPYRIDYAVRKLVRRSRGTCTRLSVYNLSDYAFAFVADWWVFLRMAEGILGILGKWACDVRFIKVLQIPMSAVTDKMVEKHAQSFSTLTFLDISYCLNITAKGIDIFGRCCKSLTHLRRNMPPPQWDENLRALSTKIDDAEAMTIADSMPGLCHLELCHGKFSDIGLTAILAKCKKLTNLNILGCWNVELNGTLEDMCAELESFKSPWFDEFEETDSSDAGEGAYSDSD